MKKFLFLLLFVPSFLCAKDYEIYSYIGPTSTTNTTTVINLPGSGKTNCLTNFVAISTTAQTYRILDGITTTYALTVGANVLVDTAWTSDVPFCVTVNSSCTFKASAAGDGTQLNWFGFVRR